MFKCQLVDLDHSHPGRWKLAFNHWTAGGDFKRIIQKGLTLKSFSNLFGVIDLGVGEIFAREIPGSSWSYSDCQLKLSFYYSAP